MYTITRKLAMVCLAVVFSVLVYGCGGGSNDQAMMPDTDSPDMVMPNPVNTDMVTPGLTIMPGTYSIQPGETADAGDATFTCAEDGPSCDVTVADDGTVTSVGGMATAMDSAAATMRLAVEARIADAEEVARLAEEARDTAVEDARLAEVARLAAVEIARLAEEARLAAVEDARLAEVARMAEETLRIAAEEAARLAEVARMAEETLRIAAEERAALLETVNPFSVTSAPGYGNVTPGIYEIAPDGTNTAPGDDVTFACPADGELCLVIVSVNEDGVASYTSLGGAATGANSMSVMNTRMAVALHSPGSPGGNGLNTGTVPAVTVTRETTVSGGETEITLVPADGATPAHAEVEYSIGPVDPGHEIDGWSGQTMSRSEEMVLDTPQEATVYTNIDPATEQKLTLGGEMESAPDADGNNVYVLDPGEDVDAINMDVMDMDMDTFFSATYNGIPGTFTCAAFANCVSIATSMITGGQIIITNTNFADNDNGWTFESDDFVETSATQDADYMWFGYWLESPADPGAVMPPYMFAAFSGGADKFELNTGELLGTQEEALTATYEGGAAGRYVTRKLRIDAEGVDPQSPGYHGRFTATATLTANFGRHEDFNADTEADTVDTNNSIGGTITDFMDGATNLGFDVTLERTGITTGGITNGTTMATFGATATSTAANGTGAWSGEFFGPSADTSDEVMEDANTHLPSGVAGKFNANSNYANVVGAFAAE